MTRPYSLAFKQKMIQRLTGKDAVSAMRLARETGVRQQNLSRWLDEAKTIKAGASRYFAALNPSKTYQPETAGTRVAVGTMVGMRTPGGCDFDNYRSFDRRANSQR
jgi:hypothetical protein